MSEEREQTRWEQIQERGMNDVIIRRCLDALEYGAINKEGALEMMVLALSATAEQLMKELVEARQEAPPPLIRLDDKVMIHERAEQALIKTGWLPPCEGRRVMEGRLSRGPLGMVGFELQDEDGTFSWRNLGFWVNDLMEHRVRFIFDPICEER